MLKINESLDVTGQGIFLPAYYKLWSENKFQISNLKPEINTLLQSQANENFGARPKSYFILNH